MPFLTRILFATDFSDCAKLAEGYAALLAQASGARLDVLHVLDLQPGMDPEQPVTRQYLDQLRKEANGQLAEVLARIASRTGTPAAYYRPGLPAQRIVQSAKECEADLVVLGTHGRTGIGRVLLGSTAEEAVKTAPCPVLTVRSAPETPAIRRILVPVDFSDYSLEALEYAVQVATLFTAETTLLHVLEPASYGLDFTLSHASDEHKMRKRLETRLADLAGLLTKQGLRAAHAFDAGVPGEAIAAWAKEKACDLIVMGTRGRRGLQNLLIGSVAQTVLRHAACPVLTMRSPKFGPGHRRVLAHASDKTEGR
jgi:nucleotide-binding universal stress UspA family protein